VLNPVVVPLATTLMVQALVSMASVAMPVLAPVAAPAIGVSAAYVGIFVALVYAGAMISSVLSGGFVARFGPIRVSQACLVLCAAGLALIATAILPLVAIGAVIIGTGYGPVTPASSHILAKSTPPHLRSFTFSLKQTGVPLGGAMAGALLPALVLASGWHQAALAVAGASVLLAFLAQPIRAGLDRDREAAVSISMQSVTRPLAMVLAHPRLRELAVVSFIFAAMQLCLMSFLVSYLTENLNVTLVTAGIALSVANVAGIACRILWGIVADRWVRPRTLLGALGLVMAAACAATAAFSSAWPPAAILAVCAVFGGTAIGWNGIYLAEVARLAPPGQAATATGGTLFFTFFGVLFGPPLFGAMLALSNSYGVAYAAISLAPFVCGLALLLDRRPS
jgi:MFS family permease